MNSIKKYVLLVSLSVLWCSSFLSAEYQSKQIIKGLIIYLDGVPAVGKSSLAYEFAQLTNSVVISCDDYVFVHRVSYYKAAKITFLQAIKLAEQGNVVILDSFFLEEYFEHTQSDLFDIKLVGVWCPLPLLKERFDQRAGKRGAFVQCNLVQDYWERYGDKSPEEIRCEKGTFVHYNGREVCYDMFFDSEYMSSKAMAKKIAKAYCQDCSPVFIRDSV